MVINNRVQAFITGFGKQLGKALGDSKELKQFWSSKEYEAIFKEVKSRAERIITRSASKIPSIAAIFCVRTPGSRIKNCKGFIIQTLAGVSATLFDDICAAFEGSDIELAGETTAALIAAKNQLTQCVDAFVREVESKYRVKKILPPHLQTVPAACIVRAAEAPKNIGDAQKLYSVILNDFVEDITAIFGQHLSNGIQKVAQRKLMQAKLKANQSDFDPDLAPPGKPKPLHIEYDPRFLLDDLAKSSRTVNPMPFDDRIELHRDPSSLEYLTADVGVRELICMIRGIPVHLIDFSFTSTNDFAADLHIWKHAREKAMAAIEPMQMRIGRARTPLHITCVLAGPHNKEIISLLESSLGSSLNVQRSCQKLQSIFGHLSLSAALITHRATESAKTLMTQSGVTLEKLSPITRSCGASSQMFLAIWSVWGELTHNTTHLSPAGLRNAIDLSGPLPQCEFAAYEKLFSGTFDHTETVPICQAVSERILSSL
jgi:hypothetical protein